MSILTDIADAVVTELNAVNFIQPLTAQRRTVPEFDLADLKDLRVSVVPRSLSIIPETRRESRYEAKIDIGVQKKIDTDIDAEVAALGSLVDDISEHLRWTPLSDAQYALWAGVANDPAYVPEHLSQQRVFTSVLTVTYRMVK